MNVYILIFLMGAWTFATVNSYEMNDTVMADLIKKYEEVKKKLKYIVSNIPVNKTTSCPQYFVRLENSCYKFINTPSKWWHASYLCKSLGTRLVSIDNAAENTILQEYMKDKEDLNPYWTGGNDLLVEGQHIWEETKQPMRYKNWSPVEGAFDPHIGIAIRSNKIQYNCVVMFLRYLKLQWTMAPCNNDYKFVCERHVVM